MVELQSVVPVLRIFDEAKARAFYLDFLGFRRDWEHRFEPGLPIYLQISRGQVLLHLSEHHGDASPGATVRIAVPELALLRDELKAKPYRFLRPDIERKPWGTDELAVTDPFLNRLVFWSLAPASE